MNLNKLKNTLANIKGFLDSHISYVGSASYDISKSPGSDIMPGDVVLQGFVIARKEPGAPTVDILELTYQIDIYEDILSPVIFGETIVRDSENILEDYLKYDCYVQLIFGTPGRELVKYVFRVLAKENVENLSNVKGKVYKLQLASPGYEENMLGMVNPPVYQNLTYDKIVREVINNRFSNGLHVCEKSVAHFEPGGITSKTSFTNKYPFQAIDYCRQMAYSSRYPYSPWLFFENQNGYNFTTLASLIERARKGIKEDKVFKFQRFDKDDYSKVRFYHIMGFNVVQDTDIKWLIEHGGLNSAMTVENLTTGNIQQVKLSDAGVNQAQSFISMQDKPGSFTSPTQANQFAKINPNTPAHKEFRVMNGLDSYLRSWAEKQLAAKADVARLLQHVTRVHIYGHSDITVGDGITCWFEYTGDSDEKNRIVKDKAITGNYLVSKVRHRILINDRSGYSQSLELLNTSWNTELDKA